MSVKNGTFAVTLDAFPAGTFNGNLWLEIKIGADAPLTPRQPLVSVAYAMKADSVKDGAITSASIADATITAADFAPDVLNPLAWLLGGNSNTNPASHFLGTRDAQPLVLKANSQRALQMQYVQNGNYQGINVQGGYWLNSITEGVTGATVFGGINYFNSAYSNRITDHGGTVSGGVRNRAGNDNADFTDAQYAMVGGGYDNIASSNYTTIGGGFQNRASNTYATVGGGNDNTAEGSYATIAGGFGCAAYGIGATVGGGFTNIAIGDFSTAPGGWYSVAYAPYSFAAGRRAKARHTGAFVWADSTDADFDSTGVNQLNVRASGGVGINTNNPAGAKLRVFNASNTIGICAGDLAPDGAASFQSHRVTNTSSYHFACTNSGADVFYVNGSGRPFGTGAYAQISDARYKTHVLPVENALDAILNLRGVTFEWDTEKWKERGLPPGRQIGFIAQEVEKVLPELVTTDKNGYKMVSYSDAVPVLVEAVKTQQKQNTAKDAQIAELKAKNAAMEAKLNALAEAVRQLQNDRKP